MKQYSFLQEQYELTQDDIDLLKNIKNKLSMLGLGHQYGLMGNNQAHFRSLLCDDPHCYELDENEEPRQCTLNDHDKKLVLQLKDNNDFGLDFKKDHMYERICELIDRMEKE